LSFPSPAETKENPANFPYCVARASTVKAQRSSCLSPPLPLPLPLPGARPRPFIDSVVATGFLADGSAQKEGIMKAPSR